MHKFNKKKNKEKSLQSTKPKAYGNVTLYIPRQHDIMRMTTG